MEGSFILHYKTNEDYINDMERVSNVEVIWWNVSMAGISFFNIDIWYNTQHGIYIYCMAYMYIKTYTIRGEMNKLAGKFFSSW